MKRSKIRCTQYLQAIINNKSAEITRGIWLVIDKTHLPKFTQSISDIASCDATTPILKWMSARLIAMKHRR